MKELFINPEPPRYFLRDKDRKIYGSKVGYKTYRKAAAARNFLLNAESALIARYKHRMHAEMKHFKNI